MLGLARREVLESRSQNAARQALNGYGGIVDRRRVRGLRRAGPSRATLHTGPLLGARPTQVRGGRAALSGAVRGGAEATHAALANPGTAILPHALLN
jgi:hypothetical protein